MQPVADLGFSGAVRHDWRRIFAAFRPHPPSPIDPIALTMMAVNLLGPARLRAAFHGVPVTVRAPDPETAEIFRAALAQMAKERPTDRLITVELMAEIDSPGRGA